MDPYDTSPFPSKSAYSTPSRVGLDMNGSPYILIVSNVHYNVHLFTLVILPLDWILQMHWNKQSVGNAPSLILLQYILIVEM